MGDGHGRGDLLIARTGAAQGSQAVSRRQAVDHQLAAGQLGQSGVAFDGDAFGEGGFCRQAHAGRPVALQRHGSVGQRPVGRAHREPDIELAGIGQKAAHGAGVGNGPVALAGVDRTAAHHQPDLGHLLAGQALGRAAGGEHIDTVFRETAIHARKPVRLVQRRAGVRGQHDGAETAGRGACRQRIQCFAVRREGRFLGAAQVDQRGREDTALRVDHCVGCIDIDLAAGLGDDAVLDQQPAGAVMP